jgi:hypothetical protein
VRVIPEEVFQSLLSENLSDKDKHLVLKFRKDQEHYNLLTKKKYAFFWTIHNKYLPPVELEYPSVIKKVAFDITKEKLLFSRRKSNASKKRWVG